MNNFVHLHVHSDFSTLDGYGSIFDYSEKAKNNNVPYLCITDHGVMSGIPQLIEESGKHGLKPIFGCEIYTNNYNHLVPSFSDLSDEDKIKIRKNNHLILIAKNNKGYENLIKICSEGWISGFYYKPRVSFDLIKQYSEGLICTSACLGSELSRALFNNQYEFAEQFASECKEIWKDDYYIEIQMIKMKEQDETNIKLIALAHKLNIPIVLTNDVHYCEQKESYNQQIQLLLNSKGTISSPEGLEFHTDQLWYKTIDEFNDLWALHYKDTISEKDFELSKENTFQICEKCDVKIDTSPKFPKIPDADTIIQEKCFNKMIETGLIKNKVYRERLKKELALIYEKEFPSYFLIVQDIIDWTKKQGFSVGPGRGCFLPDNIVLINYDDFKEIKDIQIGDQVWSSENRFNNVCDKFEYNIDEEIIIIETDNNKTIKCTLDHSIMAEGDKDYYPWYWIMAQEIKIGQEIFDLQHWRIDIPMPKVKYIKKEHYKGLVYDLSVEHDFSYNIDGLAVHNSGAGSLVCFLLGITQVDPIKHDLLFERFLSSSRGGKSAKLQFSEVSRII